MKAEIRPCYRAENGVYFTKAGHRPDCEDSACRGCTTCQGRHCSARTNCTWHVADSEMTCGRCITSVRQDLRWIGDLSALLLTQAIADGVESESATLAGPSVDARTWAGKRLAAQRHLTAWLLNDKITEEQAAHAMSRLEDDDDLHPERLLTRWARMIAEDYNHPLPYRMTLSWCVAYLGRTLHRIAHDDEQDLPLLRAELKKCRQHLESVLHNSTSPDVGAPCPKCRTTHRPKCEDDRCNGCLVVRLRRQYAHWCKDEDCQKFHFMDEKSDTWHCPREATHWWTMEGYADLLEDRRSA